MRISLSPPHHVKVSAALVALLSFAGLAWAMQTLTVSVPAGDAWTATAVLTSGSEGAEVYGPGIGTGGDDTWELSVGIGTGGQLSINGVTVGACIPMNSHRVKVSAWRSGVTWYCDIEVRDLVMDKVRGGVDDYQLGGPVASVTASAQTLTSLQIE